MTARAGEEAAAVVAMVVQASMRRERAVRTARLCMYVGGWGRVSGWVPRLQRDGVCVCVCVIYYTRIVLVHVDLPVDKDGCLGRERHVFMYRCDDDDAAEMGADEGGGACGCRVCGRR